MRQRKFTITDSIVLSSSLICLENKLTFKKKNLFITKDIQNAVGFLFQDRNFSHCLSSHCLFFWNDDDNVDELLYHFDDLIVFFCLFRLFNIRLMYEVSRSSIL